MQKVEELDFKISNKRNEEISSLYTNINFTKSDLHVLSVISSIDKEGKTYIAKELAKMYALNNKRTLYLDYNLHNDEVINHNRGLKEYLYNQVNLEDIIIKTSIDNLFAIYSGEAVEEIELPFNEQKFINLINILKEQFDIIIIDTPSINSYIDASIISSKCDGSLFVVSSNTTKRKEVLRAKAQIKRAGINVLGVALNKVEKKYMN